MPRYWVIAPCYSREPDFWDAIWGFDLQHGLISIGWKAVGDVSKCDEAEVRDRLIAQLPDYKPSAATQAARTLHKFYHEIQPGDMIIARKGRKCVAAVGKVTRAAYYDPEKLKEVFQQFGPEYESITYPNHLDIEWFPDLRDYEYQDQVFGLQTMYEIDEETFRWFTEDETTGSDTTEGSGDEDEQMEFVLERYLEDFIVSNLTSIFRGNLALFSDPIEGPIGQQYRTDVGIIDILAQDLQSGDLVVIELKKGMSADKVVSQTLRYMGWVSENLCQEGQNVRGIIICKEPDPKMIYALKMTTNITAMYYHINFRLTDEPA
jgi:Predicted nuclease of the RecB family